MQKKVERQHKESFSKLKKYLKEEKRIREKGTVYKIDTDLDQIMTCFKLSFINLCGYFLIEFMNRERYELLTLYESFFQLKGESSTIDGKKIIKLFKNPKDAKLMKKLIPALDKLNNLNIENNDGMKLQFSMDNCNL
jgi:hypothetical protein